MPNKSTSTSIHKRTKVLKINTSSTESVALKLDNNLKEVEAFNYLKSVINQQE
jgi:hypothetical protein